MRTILLTAALIAFASTASAERACRCVNGKMRALCTSSIDLRPICPAKLCPRAPARLKPLPSLAIPPIGTTRCRQKQVLSPYTGRYEWRNICS